MEDEKNLNKLLKALKPKHIDGDYVFCCIPDLSLLNSSEIILLFKEEEGSTIIISKELADKLHLAYPFIAAWITLTAHSSLEAVGLTAAFSSALAAEGISCNVVAGFNHDHIFVQKNQLEKAMWVLHNLSA